VQANTSLRVHHSPLNTRKEKKKKERTCLPPLFSAPGRPADEKGGKERANPPPTRKRNPSCRNEEKRKGGSGLEGSFPLPCFFALLQREKKAVLFLKRCQFPAIRGKKKRKGEWGAIVCLLTVPEVRRKRKGKPLAAYSLALLLEIKEKR